MKPIGKPHPKGCECFFCKYDQALKERDEARDWAERLHRHVSRIDFASSHDDIIEWNPLPWKRRDGWPG